MADNVPSLVRVQFADHEGNIANKTYMRYIGTECRSYFDHVDFTAENIACGLSTESMKWRTGDGRTIIYINTARIEVPVYVGLAQARPFGY